MKVTFKYTAPTGNVYAAEFDTASRILHLTGHGQLVRLCFVNATEHLQLQATAAKVAAITKHRQNRDAFMGN